MLTPRSPRYDPIRPTTPGTFWFVMTRSVPSGVNSIGSPSNSTIRPWRASKSVPAAERVGPANDTMRYVKTWASAYAEYEAWNAFSRVSAFEFGTNAGRALALPDWQTRSYPDVLMLDDTSNASILTRPTRSHPGAWRISAALGSRNGTASPRRR